MEAANIGGREADVAPAADPTGGRMAGWTPADPGPLGLAAFAGTTFMLSMINAGLVGNGTLVGGGLLPMVAGLALAYGGIAQLIAGIWEFRTGNTFGAVAFCSYGAFWVSFFLIVQLGVPGVVAAKASGEIFSGLSLWLYMWAIFTTYMFVASLRTTGAVALVFLLLAITFLILGIGNASLVGGTAVTNGTIKLGGYLGLATAIAAWYASFAAVVNSTFGRVVAPVVPLRR
jgi:succinate-acetate transporter protein